MRGQLMKARRNQCTTAIGLLLLLTVCTGAAATKQLQLSCKQ
jgi:hypothetical protein